MPALFPEGTVPGHEVAGRIVEVGDGVTGWAPGDRVCVLPFAQCGECAFCLGGTSRSALTRLRTASGLGTGRAGGYAEQMIVDESMLFALPDAVSDRAGTLVEPLAVAIRAVAKAELRADEPVAVIGAGPVGLLTALVLRERGFERLAIVSRNPARADRAAALGLTAVSASDAEHASGGGARRSAGLRARMRGQRGRGPLRRRRRRRRWAG